MAEDSKIQWTTHTFNPWRGCEKVAEGCRNCYAEAQSKRNQGTLGIWGSESNGATRVVAAGAQWRSVEKWNREALTCPECGGEPPLVQMVDGRACCTRCRITGIPARPRVFVASMADVFEDWRGPMVDSRGHQMKIDTRWPEPGDWACGNDRYCRPLTMDDVRDRLFHLIDSCPNLDFLLLTKRPENIVGMWPIPGMDDASEAARKAWEPHAGMHRSNVWLLTSIANQEDANCNIPHLLNCRGLSPVLGVSAEPLVASVDLSSWLGPKRLFATDASGVMRERETRVDWIIAGGESGNNARPCNVEWIRSLVSQCKSADVPVFVKQLGRSVSIHLDDRHEWPRHQIYETDETVATGWAMVQLDDKKGGDPGEWPEDLRVREMPCPS